MARANLLKGVFDIINPAARQYLRHVIPRVRLFPRFHPVVRGDFAVFFPLLRSHRLGGRSVRIRTARFHFEKRNFAQRLVLRDNIRLAERRYVIRL